MKKLSALIFAVVSTMFLAVGATRAAEKFDGLSMTNEPSVSGPMHDGVPPPCVVVDPQSDR